MRNQKLRIRHSKPLGFKGFLILGSVAAALTATAAFLFYFKVSRQYETVFFPNTMINGVDASKKSVEEVKAFIASGIKGYVLSIEEREGAVEEIAGADIDLTAVFDGRLEQLLEEQESLQWIKYRKTLRAFEIDTMIQYDEEKLEKAVSGLACFGEDVVKEPENAYISDYVPGQGYLIAAEKEGTRLDFEKVKSGISQAVLNLEQKLSLEALDAYLTPQITAENPELVSRVQELNKYADISVTHVFGEERERLDGSAISGWLGTGEDGNIYVSSSAVTEYVKELASRYDTYTKAKSLKTSYGKTISITGGSYGWKIDQSAEADQLAQIIRSGESQVREPVYKQKAVGHGTSDYGSTYVEINLTAQHLYFYKEGKLMAESDFVSGNEAKGWSTPAGSYSISYKQRNAVLKGENYATPVSYWMPFNGNIGLHDASWRSSFGGNIYKSGGSHGCINLPPSVARTIFENISSGVPVLCYRLPGTESKKTSKPSGKTEESKAASGGQGDGTGTAAGSGAGAGATAGANGSGGTAPSGGTGGAGAGTEAGATGIAGSGTANSNAVGSGSTSTTAPPATSAPIPSTAVSEESKGIGPGFSNQNDGKKTGTAAGPGVNE